MAYLSSKWHHVMFTQTENLYILNNYELIVPLMEDSFVDNVSNVLLVTLGKEEHCSCVTLWCPKQSFAFRILTYTFENSTNSTRHLFHARLCLYRSLFESFAGSTAYVLCQQSCRSHFQTKIEVVESN